MEHQSVQLLKYKLIVFFFSEKYNPQQQQKKQVSDFLVRPFFDTGVSSNITTQLGGHAYMPCRVKQLGNKSVSVFYDFTIIIICTLL